MIPHLKGSLHSNTRMNPQKQKNQALKPGPGGAAEVLTPTTAHLNARLSSVIPFFLKGNLRAQAIAVQFNIWVGRWAEQGGRVEYHVPYNLKRYTPLQYCKHLVVGSILPFDMLSRSAVAILALGAAEVAKLHLSCSSGFEDSALRFN